MNATGIDGIPIRLRIVGGPALHSKLQELFFCCWEKGKLPSDHCDTVIVTLYKNKEKYQIAPSIRGSLGSSLQENSLLVLLNRLVPTMAEDYILETQSRFSANRSTTDMVFVLRQLQAKDQEHTKNCL